MTAKDLAQLVRDARFTPVRFREGYDRDEVDHLLDQLIAALEAGEPVGQLVEGARFTPVRMRESYEMNDVDNLLAEIVARAEGRGAPAGPAQRPPRSTTSPNHPAVIVEHTSWWSRLRGSKNR